MLERRRKREEKKEKESEQAFGLNLTSMRVVRSQEVICKVSGLIDFQKTAVRSLLFSRLGNMILNSRSSKWWTSFLSTF